MKRKEKFIWIGIGSFLLLFMTAVTFAPTVSAQSITSREAETREYLDIFEDVFKFVRDNYVDEVPVEQLFEGAMKGLFEGLDDPHSYYLTASDLEDFSDTTTGKFGGVGLYITKTNPLAADGIDLTDRQENQKYIEVIAPIENTPAYREGIHAGDFIIEIEGESTEDITVDQAVEKLRGEPGTKVEVTILRGKDITFKVTITRAVIEVPTVKYDMIPDNIGYVRIIQFTPYTPERTREALNELKNQGATSIIIDVRGNPGGLLSAVVDTVDFFQQRGVIVSTRSRIPSENEVFTANRNTVIPMDTPIIVLVNKGSASASEILAGALKDTDRGLLLGETTFGKGSVQQIRTFGAGGFKLTMARYYTPSGTNIDKVGIDPDIVVKEPELSDEQLESYKKIIEENRIPQFVNANPNAGENKISEFVNKLQAEGFNLTDRYLNKMVREELNRKMDFPPVYDLKFDIQLQKAVELLRSGEYTGE